jgi:hypothetical protein
MRRNNLRNKFVNATIEYRNILKKKNRDFIVQFKTPILEHIEPEDYDLLEIDVYTWKLGDRLFKLAHQYYGRSDAWWIIAMFNSRPTDQHYRPGDEIYIPTNYVQVLQLIDITD